MNFLEYLNEDDVAYQKYFDWKDDIDSNFLHQYDKCMHLAECRVCHWIASRKQNR